MNGERGFTLVEVVVSVVVLSISVGGLMLAFGTALRDSPRPNRLVQAGAIAEAYLEEILLLPMDDPDGIGGETARADLDDVFDYHGLSDSPPEDQTGTALPGLSAYQVDVSVVASGALGPGGSPVPAADAVRVDVRVRRGTEIDITLNGYRARY